MLIFKYNSPFLHQVFLQYEKIGGIRIRFLDLERGAVCEKKYYSDLHLFGIFFINVLYAG